MSLLAPRTPVLPIGALPRVDLLPPSEMRRRDMLARARTWVYIGVGALAVAALTVGAAFALSLAASLRLASEQAQTQRILTGIADLSDVSAALSTRGQLEGMRQQAMGGDLAWGPVLDLVSAHTPAGVAITGYALEAGTLPDAGIDPADATGVSGTVTFTTTAAVDLVAATRDLRAADGIRSAELESLTSDESVFTYTIRLELDQSVYTGAFAPEGEE